MLKSKNETGIYRHKGQSGTFGKCKREYCGRICFADKTEAEIDEIAHKGAYAFNKAGRKGVQETKKNIQSAKDGIQRFKQQRAEKSINVRESARKNYNGWQFFSADADIIGNQNA